MLNGLTCHDIELLLNGESFNPQVFTSYMKLVNIMHEIKLDCSELL